MTIPYSDILLWGHSYDAYIRMFALSDEDLKLKILDCCGGPSSFNTLLTQKGGQVISTDQLFALPKKKLEQKIDEVFSEMLAIVEAHKERFTWDEIKSPQELAAIRRENINIFLDDFEKGREEGRFITDIPPELHFQHYEFDLALVSHYFFANCPDQSTEYHVDAITNLCDVAKEVRIFPLLNSSGEIPDIVGPVTQGLHQAGLGVEIKAAPYKFQKKGNAMLRVWAQTCEV